MNHLLRSTRADQRLGLEGARRRGARAAHARARRAQARRLLGPARLGVLGHEPRADRGARVGAVRRGDRRPAGACCRSSRSGRTSSSRCPSCATSTAAPTTPTSSRWTRPPTRLPWPRTRRCSTAGRARSRGSPRRRRTRGSTLGDKPDLYPRPVAAAVERLLHNGISGPYGLALGGEQYQRVVETAEHGGYPLLEHLRKIIEGPIIWAPGVGGAVVVSLRGGDFVFESGQDISIGYESHDAESGAAVPRGELQLPRGDARGRGGAHRLLKRIRPVHKVTAPLSASWTSAATERGQCPARPARHRRVATLAARTGSHALAGRTRDERAEQRLHAARPPQHELAPRPHPATRRCRGAPVGGRGDEVLGHDRRVRRVGRILVVARSTRPRPRSSRRWPGSSPCAKLSKHAPGHAGRAVAV